MIIERKKLADLKPAPYNPRTSTKQQEENLKASLEKFGVVEPVIFNKQTGHIVGGHFRVRELKKLGHKEIDCVVVDLNEEDEKELNIRLNANTGDFDWERLANEWDAEQLLDWGLKIPNFEPAELEAEEDDFDVPEIETVKTSIKYGDIIEIGQHRLMCGDSTDSDQVAKLMNGQKADMVFTDPPYNMQMKGGCVGEVAKNMRKVEKDIEFISNFNPAEFLNTLPIVFENKKMNAYIFCNKDLVPNYLNYAIENKYSFNILIWKKPNAIPIGDSHRPDIEYLLLFRKSAIWNNGLKDVNYSRCLEFGRERGLHPIMKPIELIANEMKISSNENSLVFDFFLGSGSTMIAAHQLERVCYGMELDEKYCQVIIDRMLKLEPSIPVLVNGKKYKPEKE